MIDQAGIHSGSYDGDDIELVADALMAGAVAAEVWVTPRVLSAASALGGEAERLRTRLKARESVVEKLGRFREAESPHYRLRRFNDALRYTIVLPGLIYWRAARSAATVLRGEGIDVLVHPTRWRSGNYKGLNLTVCGPDRFKFEIQLHTARSLAAAELTHDLYAEQRRLDPADPRYRELTDAAKQAWDLVPVPPGGPGVR